jgi:hypothetical protein
VPLLSESDLGGSFVLGWETYLTNEDRAAFYDDPDDALSFYEEYGRIGGIRRVFDDFDSSEAAGVPPTVIVVQADVYDTAAGAAGAMSDCDEFLDSMWEFVTDMGFEFYEPEYVDGSQVGEESCLYSAEEDVGDEDTSLKLTFVGFRQENALVIVGVLTLTDYDFQMPVLLAQAQSLLLGGTVAPGDNGLQGQPTPEDAIAEFLYGYGIEYAGDCSYADPAVDVGRYCSTAFDDRGSSVIYLAGPTFSEYDTWFLTEQYADGSWGVTESIDVTYDLSGDLALPPW